MLVWLVSSDSVRHTSRNNGLQAGSVDESPLDGLGLDVGPVDPLLQGVVVHHRHVVDVGDRQGGHDVQVGVVQVHASYLCPPHIEEELLQCFGGVNIELD